jgi:hypothetical protein
MIDDNKVHGQVVRLYRNNRRYEGLFERGKTANGRNGKLI